MESEPCVRLRSDVGDGSCSHELKPHSAMFVCALCSPSLSLVHFNSHPAAHLMSSAPSDAIKYVDTGHHVVRFHAHDLAALDSTEPPRSSRADHYSFAALAAMSDADVMAACSSARSSFQRFASVLAARGIPVHDSSGDDASVRTHSTHTGCARSHADRGADQTFDNVVPLKELLGPSESPEMSPNTASKMRQIEYTASSKESSSVDRLTSLRMEPVAVQTPRPRRTGFVRLRYSLKRYVRKFLGQHVATPVMAGRWNILLAFIASFVGIAVPALMHYNLLDAVNHRDWFFLIPSFGASAVLLYGVPQSDLAQPRNVFGGHLISSTVGVAIRFMVPLPHAWGDPAPTPEDPVYERFLATQWIACALAVSLSITFMALARCSHPPGGATALIPILIAPAIQKLQWEYVGFVSVTAGVMILIALFFNNLPRKTVWPKYWL